MYYTVCMSPFFPFSLQLVGKLRELRERETLTNTLHRHLQTLTHTLSAADKLVKERDDVIEVRGHIQQSKVWVVVACDSCHGKWRTFVSGDARAAVKPVRLG